jgi:hypothetical protein
MRIAVTAVVVLLLVAGPAAAREASTFDLAATGSKGALSVHAAGTLTQTVLDGATVTASLGGGKTVSAKSYSWSWHESSNMMHGRRTQTMTLKVQITSATGVADCAAGTNGVVKLVDSNVKLATGRTKDSVAAGHWSAPCRELTVTLANAGKAKASVTITRR